MTNDIILSASDVRRDYLQAGSGNTLSVIRNVNLHIVRGEKLAIVGKSGSGKTTLVNLIPRFYDISSGKLMIDSENIENYSLRSLRSNISLVTQEVTLFNDSILNNIAYGKAYRPFCTRLQRFARWELGARSCTITLYHGSITSCLPAHGAWTMGHGLWPWALVMAMPLSTAMAFGHGFWPWP